MLVKLFVVQSATDLGLCMALIKFAFRDQLNLETVLDDIIYTCGMDLQECIPADVTDDEKRNQFF